MPPEKEADTKAEKNVETDSKKIDEVIYKKKINTRGKKIAPTKVPVRKLLDRGAARYSYQPPKCVGPKLTSVQKISSMQRLKVNTRSSGKKTNINSQQNKKMKATQATPSTNDVPKLEIDHKLDIAVEQGGELKKMNAEENAQVPEKSQITSQSNSNQTEILDKDVEWQLEKKALYKELYKVKTQRDFFIKESCKQEKLTSSSAATIPLQNFDNSYKLERYNEMGQLIKIKDLQQRASKLYQESEYILNDLKNRGIILDPAHNSILGPYGDTGMWSHNTTASSSYAVPLSSPFQNSLSQKSFQSNFDPQHFSRIQHHPFSVPYNPLLSRIPFATHQSPTFPLQPPNSYPLLQQYTQNPFAPFSTEALLFADICQIHKPQRFL